MRSLNNIVQADLADASDTSSNHTAWAMTRNYTVMHQVRGHGHRLAACAAGIDGR